MQHRSVLQQLKKSKFGTEVCCISQECVEAARSVLNRTEKSETKHRSVLEQLQVSLTTQNDYFARTRREQAEAARV